MSQCQLPSFSLKQISTACTELQCWILEHCQIHQDATSEQGGAGQSFLSLLNCAFERAKARASPLKANNTRLPRPSLAPNSCPI